MVAVRPKRQYNSTRRRQQASASRQAVLDAAQHLFERDGYVATTMEAIAGEAGVALKTVYAAFTTKSGLLRALWDMLLKGGTADAPVAQRAWYIDMLQEPDAERKLRLVARNSVIVKCRIGPILRVIRSASAVDPDSADLWQLIQTDFYENHRVIVRSLQECNGLRRGLSEAQASDILWTLNHPDVWLLLAGERGWTPDQFESWFADAICQQLLEPSSTPRPRIRR